MNEERLFCRCGIEVRIVRLNPEQLGLGHVQQPRQNHHYVRLASAAADRSRKGSEDSQPQRRVSDPTQRATGTRAAPDGLISDRNGRSGRLSSGISQPSEQGRSQRGPLASTRGSAPSAGALTSRRGR